MGQFSCPVSAGAVFVAHLEPSQHFKSQEQSISSHEFGELLLVNSFELVQSLFAITLVVYIEQMLDAMWGLIATPALI